MADVTGTGALALYVRSAGTAIVTGASMALVPELRDMIAEPTSDTYVDADLSALIERFPLIDSNELEPDDSLWTATYDLNAAAANIWGRKAAACAGLYDFSADGGTFHRSQAAKDMRAQARYYQARSAPSSLRAHIDHDYERDQQSDYWRDSSELQPASYIANAAEPDEDE